MDLLIATIMVTVAIVLGVILYWWLIGIFRCSREKTFRNTLRRWGYSDRAIDKAVEEQGW